MLLYLNKQDTYFNDTARNVAKFLLGKNGVRDQESLHAVIRLNTNIKYCSFGLLIQFKR